MNTIISIYKDFGHNELVSQEKHQQSTKSFHDKNILAVQSADLMTLEKRHRQLAEIVDSNKNVILDKFNNLKFNIPIFENSKPDIVEKPKPDISKNFNGITGLYYIPNYLSKNEIAIIKNYIDNNVKLVPITASKGSRRVAHFGYYYSYDRTGLKPAPPIPNLFQKLVVPDKINELLQIPLEPFDQMIINEYKHNQQIAYHTDHPKLFGPIIACITIGQAVPIYFQNNNDEIRLDIAEGSMYIMTGDARYIWKHSLKNTLDDTRYSLTFRNIVK